MFHIRITVIKGMDLHTNTLSPPSPYCIVSVGLERKQTQPKHHEHNPAWEESFVFDVNDPNIGVLNIEVHSHGIENHLIGRGEVPINMIPRGQPRREIIQLSPRGQIEVELFAEDYGQGGYGGQQGFQGGFQGGQQGFQGGFQGGQQGFQGGYNQGGFQGGFQGGQQGFQGGYGGQQFQGGYNQGYGGNQGGYGGQYEGEYHHHHHHHHHEYPPTLTYCSFDLD